VDQLKPWTRAVVTAWVLALVPFLAFNLIAILTYAPRVMATGWDSFWLRWDQTTGAFGEGQALEGTAGVIQLIALALPAIGLTYSFGRFGTRLPAKAWRSTEGKPVARAGAILAMGGVAALLAFLWWPDADYTPIQPGERWTVQEAAATVAVVAGGGSTFADVEASGNTASQDGPLEGSGSEAPAEGTETEPTTDPTGTVSPSPEPTDTAVSPSPVETTTP
jgi:putative peptide zinc metalloprotease protein